MNTPNDKRSFLKWSLLGLASLAAGFTGVSLLRKPFVASLPCGPVIETDLSEGFHFRILADQDFMLKAPVNAVDGHKIVWEITQDAAGSRKIEFDRKFAFCNDLRKPVLSPEPHKTDYLTTFYHAPTDQWRIVAFIKGY